MCIININLLHFSGRTIALQPFTLVLLCHTIDTGHTAYFCIATSGLWSFVSLCCNNNYYSMISCISAAETCFGSCLCTQVSAQWVCEVYANFLYMYTHMYFVNLSLSSTLHLAVHRWVVDVHLLYIVLDYDAVNCPW